MLKDLFDRIKDDARGELPVLPIHESPTETVVSIFGDGGYAAPEHYDRAPVQFVHRMDTVDSFIAYLNGEADPPFKGCVFVGEESVNADLNYRGHLVQGCRLPLELSPEHRAIRKLGNGVTQAGLWKLLVTDLAGCAPDDLVLAARNVSMKLSGAKDVQIDNSGIVSGKDARTVTLTMGDASETLKLDWVIKKIRIWECFDKTYEIDLRLVIEPNDEGVRFTFYAVRIDLVIRQARIDLASAISKAIEKFPVYIGDYGTKDRFEPFTWAPAVRQWLADRGYRE